MSLIMNLFEQTAQENVQRSTPLAERMRPQRIDAFVGQDHLLAQGKPLRAAFESGEFGSLILWGPPGSGKTTLAKLLAGAARADFFMLSAVASGVSEVREVLQKAMNNRKVGKQTVLFIDEIHRFNKAQQDALLQRVEDGTITLIGATTENPSFEVISPLLSRCQVYTLKALSDDALLQIIEQALANDTQLKNARAVIDEKARR
ncbi:AAA family ATPase, partial [candidate division KSB1 bacterium]|nr:AAA family ATPase [candidate division KSB1 bacterium]